MEQKSIQPFKNEELVILRNPVARAKFGLSLVQTKFLFEVLAYFKNNPEQRFARFYLRDYLVKLGISSNNIREYIHQMEDMRRRDINIPRSIEANKLHFIGVSLFSSAEYMIDENGDGFIEIEVSDKLKPYFLEIANGDFFHYHIFNTRVLRSTYSIKLYLLLKSYRRFGKLEIGLEELRDILEIAPTEYLLFKNFKARVLETARLEMMEKNDICFEYIDVRRNRKSPIEKIVFRIFDNPKAKEIAEKAREFFSKSETIIPPKVAKRDLFSQTPQESIIEIIDTDVAKDSKPPSALMSDVMKLFRFFEKEALDSDVQSFVQNYDLEHVMDVLLYAKMQVDKQKTDIKNIYSYIVSGVRNRLGKGLTQQEGINKEKAILLNKKKEKSAQSRKNLEDLLDSYEKAKNAKIRELTSDSPAITDKAVEAVKAFMVNINPEIVSMTIEDFRINPMYREFVKKEIYEANMPYFEELDKLYLPQIEGLKQIIKDL